jgi:hypothetical protein
LGQGGEVMDDWDLEDRDRSTWFFGSCQRKRIAFPTLPYMFQVPTKPSDSCEFLLTPSSKYRVARRLIAQFKTAPGTLYLAPFSV